jgi:hypothetical protein
MDVTSGRGLRNTEDLADFFERQAVLVAEHDNGPLIRPEPREGGLESASERPPLNRFPGRGRRGLLGGIAGIDVDRGGPGPPKRIDAGVVSDAKQPTGQPALGVECRQIAEGFDERLLSQVLGQRRIAGQPDEQAQNRALITAQDLLERGLRTGQRLRDEPRLRYRFEVNWYEESSSGLTR